MEAKDIQLLVFDTISDRDASYSIAGINNLQLHKNSGRYRIRSEALTQAPIMTIDSLNLASFTFFGEVLLIGCSFWWGWRRPAGTQ